ncbi:MAG: cysteine--tRNA ligase [Candidatus Aenigmarchaeota archaeon]|nr:cysteine--tRNA ligase [Candidatus Aenigmarchaeota archaeon]
MLMLYNTLSRKKEKFTALNSRKVKMYTCGLTVYDYAHIGNWRAFISADILRRYLLYSGYNVEHVMNITDIDDKTIKGAAKKSMNLKEYTTFYERAFMNDMEMLNVLKPTIMPRATETIADIIKLVEVLIKKGYAYESNGSVYYKISRFRGYGKLSGIDVMQHKTKSRVDSDEYKKEDARDFVLWKSSQKQDEKVGAVWKIFFGRGRPGWHIECSAMAMKYLGEQIDVHTGGIDLIFPHHENEIAQSEAVTGKQFVRYWVHCSHLFVNSRKMSKSLGNFLTLKDVIKTYSPRDVRFFLIFTHYRSDINYTDENMRSAHEALTRIDDFMLRLGRSDGRQYNVSSLIKNAKYEFEIAMNDDINVPNALKSIFTFIREVNVLIDSGKISKKNSGEITEFMNEIDHVLGILSYEKIEIDDNIKKLIDEREEARKNKDFKKADEIREKLKKLGIALEDSETGVVWKRVAG